MSSLCSISCSVLPDKQKGPFFPLPSNSSRLLSSNLASNVNFFKIRVYGLRDSVSGRSFDSWVSPDRTVSDDFGGWVVTEIPSNEKRGKWKWVLGVGASLAVIVACFCYWNKGFKSCPLISIQVSQQKLKPSSLPLSHPVEDVETSQSDRIPAVETDLEQETSSFKSIESKESPKPLVIPVPMDSTQQEAWVLLKKLKIIEENIKPEDLCTRREYARWLVRLNSLLERSPHHQIVPAVLIHVFTNAFQDISADDPDFRDIQALAECGILPSQLSHFGSSDVTVQSRANLLFHPESSISRVDLIIWKAKTEYCFSPGILSKMSRKQVDFIDAMALSHYWSDSLELFLDVMAGDKGITRKVFGHSKRFQPNKPVTKAQAAVALTSGRMVNAVHAELRRLEVEKLSREAEMKEIRTELLLKADIQKFWNDKIAAEHDYGIEMEKHYHDITAELEKEKGAQESYVSEMSRGQSALRCQEKLLVHLKEEVDSMSTSLTAERDKILTERRNLEEKLVEAQAKVDAIAETKCLVEAEVEALQIFRNWVEDEARRTHARVQILEAARRRWKGEDTINDDHVVTKDSSSLDE